MLLKASNQLNPASLLCFFNELPWPDPYPRERSERKIRPS